MHERFLLFALSAIVVLGMLDIYVYKGLRTLFIDNGNPQFKHIVMVLHWAIAIAIYAGLFFAAINADIFRKPSGSGYLFSFVGIIFLFAIPKLVFIVFHAMNDLVDGGFWVYEKMTPQQPYITGERISRGRFLTQMGAFAAAIPFASIAYGILKGKYDFRVISKTLSFENLPRTFDGLKIALVSDIHIGSFGDDHEAVQKGIDLVNEQEPDYIFFTGDLVNNFAHETDGWLPVLSQFRAKYGKYSILGNHDYGDYVLWDSAEEKRKNLQNLVAFHDKMGFRLLLNENEHLSHHGESIGLIGVENWGRPPFVQYGDLEKAMKGTEDLPFKILLSHDPSHWDEKVLGKTPIDLTFSGHTHGMQFGVEIGKIKWSPVSLRYPRWAGLYTEFKQQLYVNRGFGFIGFPGRVGMPPEITVITLKTNSV